LLDKAGPAGQFPTEIADINPAAFRSAFARDGKVSL
jgi:hypothetical protein